MSAGICASCELLRIKLRAEQDRAHDLATRVMTAEGQASELRAEVARLTRTLLEATSAKAAA